MATIPVDELKIIDRYVFSSFLRNYLISFMVLIGLYVTLDMVFQFDEFAKVGRRAHFLIFDFADQTLQMVVSPMLAGRFLFGEKKLPRDYITADGFHITAKARRYLSPLIRGEDYPPYKNGLPDYVQIKGVAVKKKLNTDFKP